MENLFKTAYFSLNEGMEVRIELGYYPSESTWVEAKELFARFKNGWIIERKHKFPQTQLILDGTASCHLFKFDANRNFVSSQPCGNNHDGPFSLLVSEPFLIVLPWDNDLFDKKMFRLTIKF